jgi:hypothetical protein
MHEGNCAAIFIQIFRSGTLPSSIKMKGKPLHADLLSDSKNHKNCRITID